MADDDDDYRFIYTPLEPEMIRVMHILPDSTLDDIRCALEHRKRMPEAYVRSRVVIEDADEESATLLGGEYAALSYCWAIHSWSATLRWTGKLFRLRGTC